jgi:tetratricopeptide (TPR) repeat protein
MRRLYPGFSALLLLLSAQAARGQQTIYLQSAEKPLKGTIKDESPRGILVTGMKERIPPEDIVDIEYEIDPLSARIESYRPARKAEKDAEDPALEAKRRDNLSLAIDKYEATLKALKPGQTSAARQLEFKIATLLAARAAEDASPLDPAIARLKDFKTRHANSWQIGRALRLLGDLLLAEKQYAEAEQTYKELAQADVADATRDDAELRAARVSLRAGKYTEAQNKLQALLTKFPKGSPSAVRARIAEAECLSAAKKMEPARKLLKQVLNETKDKSLKAAAYNALGESYVQAKMFKEARWDFLWVDVIYFQDKTEHAKALYYLWFIFEQLNEPDRATECREILLNDRQFAGSEYQRLAREKKAP